MAISRKVVLSEVEKYGENLKLVKSTSGLINLRITRQGQPVEELSTGWFNFYIESWRTVIEAYFGEDTGSRVPAVALLANHKLQKKYYEIKSPFEDDWEVSAIYGAGRPNVGVGGDGFGKGVLTVHSVVDNESMQRVDGTFAFNYVDDDGGVVKVEANDFWAEFKK
ncbi:hypothetical protein PS718_04813 [Pseudomonas fluorescens]|uniref:Uncharacterized protein n=1 Tax=Pseudomonas fluorescens TaxID=294 RepID=A0A5E7EQC7_PSEFL|nr:hypothetical protein [Pseudomonas fluorescens]VVO28822.1 hypothetical protein PS718_04813 [Pseudomonas fluorescens]